MFRFDFAEQLAGFTSELKKCYFELMNKNLSIYAVDGSIEQFFTSKRVLSKGIVKLPSFEYRDETEDIFEPVNKK